MKSFALNTKKTLNVKGNVLDLTIPKIMGILNVTPDSFFDGGQYLSHQDVLNKTDKMLQEGASIIDIGGYSSRPGASDITEKEEISRILPALKLITRQFPECIISIDTFRSNVARIMIEEGASVINDVSGLQDPQMTQVIHKYKVPYILMHTRGNPSTMTVLNDYNNLIPDILKELVNKCSILKNCNIADVIIDPGFGFAKNIGQNYSLLQNLELFQLFQQPLLIGLSRKSMIFKKLKVGVEEALNGTTVLNTLAIIKGAGILRVHDVKECQEVINLLQNLTFTNKNN